MTQAWIKLGDLPSYAGVSRRTAWAWAKGGLRTVKVGGIRLTRPEWVDEYIMGHEARAEKVDGIVDEIMEGLE